MSSAPPKKEVGVKTKKQKPQYLKKGGPKTGVKPGNKPKKFM